MNHQKPPIQIRIREENGFLRFADFSEKSTRRRGRQQGLRQSGETSEGNTLDREMPDGKTPKGSQFDVIWVPIGLMNYT